MSQAKALITIDGEQVRACYQRSQSGYETALANGSFNNSASIALGFDGGNDIALEYAPPTSAVNVNAVPSDSYAVIDITDAQISADAYEIAVTMIID